MNPESFHWDDLHTTYHVAREGSLSRAGNVLGLNHSTVLRRVNRLESMLGIRLFIRHQRGYRLTDAGRLMLERMEPIVGDMHRLMSSLSTLDRSPSGTLKISTVSDFSPFFAPLLHDFREQYPQIRVQVVATDDVLSLERGDVHAAVRLGPQPRGPDLIARKLIPLTQEYFAAASYVESYGLPTSIHEVNQHLWVLPTGEKRKISGIRQLIEKIDPTQVVFQSNSFTDIHSAVVEGMGIGPVGALQRLAGTGQSLIKAEFGLQADASNMWFVYHRDMRGSARVRALQDFLTRRMPEMAQRMGGIGLHLHHPLEGWSTLTCRLCRTPGIWIFAGSWGS
ncbi:LysR family transcriptional regulator [Parahaliea maris]|uniref:LysR family transcriptional regulator n=1 Tax=Parahaliea maris TaxID=2716870 RepID=UPI00164FFAA2|nr:LysR family transcriptional regulator [Parahaliea maris]